MVWERLRDWGDTSALPLHARTGPPYLTYRVLLSGNLLVDFIELTACA